jgi:hypothetical protein
MQSAKQMERFMKTALLVVATILPLAAAHAGDAKPADPNGWGEAVADSAKAGGVGKLASGLARTPPDPGAAGEVRSFRQEEGSTPNPPGH